MPEIQKPWKFEHVKIKQFTVMPIKCHPLLKMNSGDNEVYAFWQKSEHGLGLLQGVWRLALPCKHCVAHLCVTHAAVSHILLYHLHRQTLSVARCTMGISVLLPDTQRHSISRLVHCRGTGVYRRCILFFSECVFCRCCILPFHCGTILSAF